MYMALLNWNIINTNIASYFTDTKTCQTQQSFKNIYINGITQILWDGQTPFDHNLHDKFLYIIYVESTSH